MYDTKVIRKNGRSLGFIAVLCQQRAKTMELFQNNELDDFTYNKALQKCRESFRVSDADKALLQNMKRK